MLVDIFDYVVVGAGSAGCVLANRLSSTGKTVCVLEAGPEDKSPLIHIPMGIIGLIREGCHNWGYNTEPEAHLNNRRLYWPRGKTLGGSSSINAMVYIRGTPADYNQWEAQGNKGWGWNDLFPIFKALENNERAANSWHGQGGELNVADVRSINPLATRFVNAAAEVGLPINDDFNGETQTGLGYYQVTQKEGMRFSSAKAFLTPVKQRSNLTILTETHVKRIVIESKRAVGVEVISKGQSRIIHAHSEVLLCGGAVNSPQLLLLSGIGPRTELEKLGIPVIHDLAGVGKNLQDHLDITVMIRDKSKQSVGISLFALPRVFVDVFRFIFQRRGLLTSNIAESGGFIQMSDDPEGRPNIQLHFLPTFLRDHGRKLTMGHGCTIHLCQLRPKSRGEIRLSSTDPLAAPQILANYLSHPDDLSVLVEGFKRARQIFKTKSFAEVNDGEVFPGEQVRSDEQIIAFIKENAETIYHPVGTCKMGHDDMAVVNDQLCVHGIASLRIADASIMPTLVSGNTNAPCMVIAEKCFRMMGLS